jgi:cytochrome c peroxidase
MHDLHLERFRHDERGDGPNRSFTLRGIKESPAYLHDGRCLTLEDTAAWFNIVVGAEPARRIEGAPGRVLDGL